MIERAIAILQQAGFDFTGRELAEIIWLAVHIQEPFKPEQRSPQLTVSTPAVSEPEPPRTEQTQIQTISEEVTSLRELEVPQPHAGVYLTSSVSKPTKITENREAIPIKVPAAVALRNTLALARALRPLMRKVPSATENILDEEATVCRIAEEKIWIPVVKGAPERWLELALVVEQSRSTAVWKQTITELERLLKHHGAFRDVRTWQLKFTGTEVQLFPQNSTGAYSSTPYSPEILIDPKGQRLILLVSDCISPAWRKKLIYPVLELWGHNGLITILQLLPERLWERTALAEEIPVQLYSSKPGVPNSELVEKTSHENVFDEIENTIPPDGKKNQNPIPVPVITLEPEPLLIWSRVIVGQGNLGTPGFKFSSVNEVESIETQQSAQENQPHLTASALVSRFRATASPMARRLAGLMAATPISLPVVQLIQQTLLPQSAQIHVAEVFMSGLLKSIPPLHQDSSPAYIEYEFIEGVRELLLDSVPISKTNLVLERVSEFVAQRVGLSVREFEARLLIYKDNDSLETKLRPFAQLKAQVLRRLGGDYTRLAEQIEATNKKAEAIQSLKIKDLDVTSTIQQLTEEFPETTPLEFGETLKNVLITQKIHDPFVEKFAVDRGNRFLTRNLRLKGEGNQIFLSVGGQINATMEINHDCPECGTATNQIIVGIAGEDCAQACVWIGGSTSNGWQTVSFSLKIPYTPGVYYIRTRYAQADSREDALGWWKVDRPDGPTEEANIGAIVVGVDNIFEYAGEYICAVKWGGETGTWHEGTEHLLISKQGEVQFRSRFGLAVIQNLQMQGQTLSWDFDDNQTAASITFKPGSEDGYFWEGKQTGKLFEGWLHYPNEGRIDFRGKFVDSEKLPDFLPFQEVSFEVATVTFEDEPTINVQPFEFEVATIELKKGFFGFGRTELIVKRSPQQAQYFIEELGKGVQLEMVEIKGGNFLMGAPTNEQDSRDSERPQHQVTISPFYMGKYPVTQAQWRAVASLPQVNRELNPDPSHFKGVNRPVECVSWYDAVEFCDRVTRLVNEHRLAAHTNRQYRLPSEAEWEYACRAGTSTPFHFGETITSELANYNANYTYGAGVEGTYREETTEVGSFGVANAFGLYDMHGNVWEWCLDDWHDNYKGSPTDGSPWFEDNENLSQKQGRAILRGGSWFDIPSYCRSSYRNYSIGAERGFIDINIGVRVACGVGIIT